MAINNALKRLFAVLLALLVWQAVASFIDENILLVSPIQVVIKLVSLIKKEHFFQTVMFTFLRIIAGFLLGFMLGAVLGILAGRLNFIETLLWPYMITIKSVPVASFIVLAILWLSSSKLSAFISFLMVLPIVYTNILTGIKSTDKQLLQTASIFKMPWYKRLLYIIFPNLKPYIISACSVAIGLAWKSGVATELIATPNGSLGEMLYNAKIYYLTADLLAWTVVIVLVSVLFEKMFVFTLKKLFKMVEMQ